MGFKVQGLGLRAFRGCELRVMACRRGRSRGGLGASSGPMAFEVQRLPAYLWVTLGL